MKPYTLQEAQKKLAQLIDDAQHGKPVYILDNNESIIQLVPVVADVKSRKAGSARGQIKMASDFDAPLTDFDEYMP